MFSFQVRRKHGEGTVALKTYLALCMRANFHATEDRPRAGMTDITLRELEQMTGASRPTLSKGIKLLQEAKLTTMSAHRNELRRWFEITGYDVTGWAKIPGKFLLENSRLQRFPVRGLVPFVALKVYFALLAFRDNRSITTHLSYDSIEEYCDVQRRHIRSSISLLASEGWISINKGLPVDGKNPPSEYVLGGSFR